LVPLDGLAGQADGTGDLARTDQPFLAHSADARSASESLPPR
jgi:hypothetical protein